MKRPTVKIDMIQLNSWFEIACKVILADISNPKCELRQDYFTASDLENCIKLFADTEVREDNGISAKEAGWWGYNSWSRLVVTDKLSQHTLLDLCRSYLSCQISNGTLEAHNFGRGHCSGMRFRAKGSGITEAEKETIEKKAKVKPVHLKEPGDKPLYQKKILCQANIVRKPSWARQSHRSFVRSTDDVTQVTCNRCLRLHAELASSVGELAR